MKTCNGQHVKQRNIEGFGDRLAGIRKSRGLTQAELGEAVGVSNRVIAYYEAEDAQPPGAMLGDLATALGVSADELLGIKASKARAGPKSARMRRRIEAIENLPPSDQRAVLKVLDAMIETHGLSDNGERRSARR